MALKEQIIDAWIDTRKRAKEDERVLIVTLTKEGEMLRDKAVSIPEKMSCCVKLSPEESKTLYTLLYKMLGQT